jgi:hypothetical protein
MAPSVPAPVPVIRELRDTALRLSPSEAGLSPSPDLPHVWGALMETGYPEGLATLVALADGTVSLYLGHGGGVMGAGEHASVREMARAFLRAAETHREALTPTADFPLPAVGRVRFYLLTFSGALTADADQTSLGEGRHPLSPLFYAGHDLLAEVRKASEASGRP